MRSKKKVWQYTGSQTYLGRVSRSGGTSPNLYRDTCLPSCNPPPPANRRPPVLTIIIAGCHALRFDEGRDAQAQ